MAMKTQNENDFVTVSIICQLAGGITRAAVHKWVRAGKLKAMRIGSPIGSSGGRMMLFERSEVLRCLAERNRRKRARQRKRMARRRDNVSFSE